jgi:hypothetical protein
LVRDLQITETAIDHSYEGMAIITPDDRVMYANPHLSVIFPCARGYPCGEIH